jgi:hypothetical protein
MAKAKICPICGKEYHTAFFGNDESGCLAFGSLTLAREECYNISCCAACAQRFEALAKEEGQRFAAKLTNMKRARRMKLTDETIARLFMNYLGEMAQHPVYHGEDGLPITFCSITPDGHFCMTEADTTVMNITAKNYRKDIQRFSAFDDRHVFGKEDVTRLEYRLEHENPTGLFSGIYTFEIRLNDEKDMTFRPCITRCIIASTGLLDKRKAMKEMLRKMEVFQRRVGVNLPITKVKKFK